MSFQQQKKRAMTPKGQMSGNGSGPAIMMMPPHIRATFMPPPPLKHLPPFKRHVLMSDNYVTDEDDNDNEQKDTIKKEEGEENNNKVGPSGIAKIPTSFPKLKRGAGLSGVSSFLHHFERTSPPPRTINPTPNSIKDDKIKAKKDDNEAKLAPLIEAYRKEQKDCSGEFTNGMNCYNTLFVGRLAYEVTERKLLREMETYGPIKDLKLITNKKTGESRGYAFVEYENEEDMKRAFRGADGMRIEGRPIVVDVERGHTVPNWLPRKFGGGLGGKNMTYGVGRAASNPGNAQQMNSMGPPMGMGGVPPPPMGGGGYGGPPQMHGGRGGPPPMMGRGGPPPMMMGRGGPPMGFNDRGRDGYGDRSGGGGYNGPPPPGYGGDRGRSYGYGGDSRGGYRDNNRGPPQGSYGDRDRDRRDSRSGGLAWERGGSSHYGGGDRDRDRKRRRSRSRSPDHHRRRGRY